MILGAYMTYLCSHLFETHFPSLYSGYFFFAMAIAFVAAGALDLLVEWLLIRHLYARPLDVARDLGVSLIMQQAFRSTFGARGWRGIAAVDDGLAPRRRLDRSADQRPVRHGAGF
jgi:urea transport system permease protein